MEITEIAVQLHQSSDLVGNLLENLLDWAQVQTDEILAIPAHFDIAELIEENLKLLSAMAKIKILR